MIVMPSNNSGIEIGRLCGKFPKRLGWLMSPDGWRNPPTWMPYALDNGAFGAWKNGTPWDESVFLKHLEQASRSHLPLWTVVPDVVMDREGTLKKWDVWAPKIRTVLHQCPLAFAVQDGMTPADVPSDADVVFIGGSTEWKWKNLLLWTKNFPRVHVARVNTERMLWMADDAGAMSCDGTGWMRGDRRQFAGLERYLEDSNGEGRSQMIMETLYEPQITAHA